MNTNEEHNNNNSQIYPNNHLTNKTEPNNSNQVDTSNNFNSQYNNINHQFNSNYSQVYNDNQNINSNNMSNEIQQGNSNNANIEKSPQIFSKASKIIMIFVLISSLIIFLDMFIMNMDWYWRLMVSTIFTHDEQLHDALQNLTQLVEVFNWLIVVIITILSIIFLIRDKKKEKDTTAFKWYIIAGLLHIFIGTIGLTPLLYSVSTLIISITHKNSFLNNNKSNKKYLVFSIITTIIIGFLFVGKATNLFDKVEDKVNEFKETQANKEKTIKDSDNTHVITTFDNIISDWGNDITKNKSYKIQNVKLNNITASLYIDYIYELNSENPSSTIVFKHGDTEIYKYTDTTSNFNISYLQVFNNFILYGISNCDKVNNGICEKHSTYSQVLAFNKNDSIPFYNSTVISSNGSYNIYTGTSVFMEDENIYADPYNDFRVYDIKIKDNYIYFYTVAEEYDSLFIRDKFTYKECNNSFWWTSTFDMQRVYKTNIVYDETYKYYKMGDILKQNSIKYSDYCKNENVLNISKNN